MTQLKKISIGIFLFLFFSKSAYSQVRDFVDHELVSNALANPNNRHHRVLSKVAPLVLRKMFGGGSATVVAKSNDGQGLILTALHIENSKFPQDPEKLGLKESGDWAFELQPILRNDKSPVESVIKDYIDPKHVIPVLSGFTLYSPKFDRPYDQVNSSLYPKNDFALIALPQVGAWYWYKDPQTGLPSQLPGKYSPLPLTSIRSDPLGTAEPMPGSEAVLVGFPKNKTPDPSTQNVLDVRNGQSYSTGQILSDTEANELFKTAVGVEKLLPYDSSVEFLVLGKASPGFSGGGAFDVNGKYLGMLVRVGKFKDGREFVRVVRAKSILSQAVQKIQSISDDRTREMTLGLIPKEIIKKTKTDFCKTFYR